ncbi:MAG: hypothetical protein JJT88_19190 [Gammaproteobacteria bacterium]|nr:hypothetical protein [Gammaproteobacteria bacterium]
MEPEHRELERYMKMLCRMAYGLEWTDHLEYVLWHACIQGPMRYGRLDLTQEHLDDLRDLSDASDGWITRDVQGVPCWLPLREWQDRYASNVDIIRLDEATPPPPDLRLFGN